MYYRTLQYRGYPTNLFYLSFGNMEFTDSIYKVGNAEAMAVSVQWKSISMNRPGYKLQGLLLWMCDAYSDGNLMIDL